MSMTENTLEPSVQLPNYYFDMNNGEWFVVGEDVEYCARINQYEVSVMDRGDFDSLRDSNGRIQDLGSLLVDASLEDIPSIYSWMIVDDWEKDDYLSNVRWLDSVIKSHDPAAVISTEILVKASRLGIGPGKETVLRGRGGFGNLTRLYIEAGLQDARKIGIHRDVGVKSIVRHLENVARETSQKPTHAILEQRIKEGYEEPTPFRFRQHGDLAALLEIAGFPNIRRWSEADFVNWGVKFMEDNDGLAPASFHFHALSKQSKGPSFRSIQNNFPDLETYQQKVIDSHQARFQEWPAQRALLLEEVDDAVKNKDLPTQLISTAPTEMQRLRRALQYRIVEVCGIDMTSDVKQHIASMPTQTSFVLELLDSTPGLKVDQIMEAAKSIATNEALWPTPPFLPSLKIVDTRETYKAAAIPDKKLHDEVVALLERTRTPLPTPEIFKRLGYEDFSRESLRKIMGRVAALEGSKVKPLPGDLRPRQWGLI